MEREWLTPRQLMGVAGLPTSRQGLNKRAREEGWEKRRRKGVQGRAVEYAVDSLPQTVRQRLQMEEAPPPGYAVQSAASLQVFWGQIFLQLSAREQEALITFVLREGAVAMLSRLGIAQDTGVTIASPARD